MNILIETIFDAEDTEMIEDPLEVILWANGVEVMSGDTINDNIFSRTQGFLEALDFLKIPYTLEETSGKDSAIRNAQASALKTTIKDIADSNDSNSLVEAIIELAEKLKAEKQRG
jgi:hypothetical protein